MVARHALVACGILLFLGCAEPMTTLLAFSDDVEEGTALDRSQFFETQVPSMLVSANAVKPKDLDALLGKPLRLPLRRGDLLLASYVGARDRRISEIVQKRGRAVTLTVSGAEGLHANDHVDLLAVLEEPTTKAWQTQTLLQNSVVLSLGPADHEPPAAGEPVPVRRVTLMLLPAEAELALLAEQMGALHVTVRNPEDLDVQEERGRTALPALLAGERARALETLRMRTLQGPLGGGVARAAARPDAGVQAETVPAEAEAPPPAAPASAPVPVLPSRRVP